MAGSFDIAQICLNGHVITHMYEDHPEYRQDFCDQCGQKTLTACPSCSATFRGHNRGIPILSEGAPSFCYGCGRALPWTTRALDAARTLALEAEDLTDEEREELANSLDDLVRDSAQTEVAANRFKRLAAKAGGETANAMKSILIAVATEAAKKAIW